jgi:hypothetical protein
VVGQLDTSISISRRSIHGEILYKRRLQVLEDFAALAVQMRDEYVSLIEDIQEGWTIENVQEDVIQARFGELDKIVGEIKDVEARARAYFDKDTLKMYDTFALIHAGFQQELKSVIYGEEPEHDLEHVADRMEDLIYEKLDHFREGVGVEAVNVELDELLSRKEKTTAEKVKDWFESKAPDFIISSENEDIEQAVSGEETA